ncbi:hypothetical protein [Winogradskyella algicola]|uniref:hypothetical protein n=1 Tax=Winogradskyella algicola TaxID=2575815 RepID=UPI001108537D|nr:hypothetical protein [Winogradskyella algicola]
MKIFKKGVYYILALLMLSVSFSCEEDDQLNIIEGLDFNIAELNPEGNRIGVIATTIPPDGRIVYTVDFGNPNDDADVFETSGPMVTYEYPEETATYTITVTASLPGRNDVSISEDYTVIFQEPDPDPVDNPFFGTWRLAPEAGALGVGPGQGDVSWWSNSAEDVATRDCLFDDEYVFNADNSFQNILGAETWLEPWQGTDPEACGTPVFPHDGTATASYEFTGSELTITGTGAFMGLAKVVNGAELASGDTVPESRTYQYILSDDGLSLTLQIQVAGDGWWSFRFVKDAPPAPSALEGAWRLAPEAGAFGVGPGQGNVSWFSSSLEDVTTRDCLFDDEYVFNADGTFQNVLGSETWLEAWQGQDPEGCGTPVFPHDGTASATYDYDATNNTLTIEGAGAFLGLAKVFNGGELANPADAVDSIEYIIDLVDENTMILDIPVAGDGWWRFKLVRDAAPANPLVGSWRLAPEAGAFGVGPGQGNVSWFSSSDDDVTTRDCLFDDDYVFNADGTFENLLGSETWVEAWQGNDPEGCAAPVFPHDGSASATYDYDAGLGTVTLNGAGAFLGLAKAINGAELANPSDAPDSVEYIVDFEDDNTIIVDIAIAGDGWWRFKLVRQ